MDTGDLVNVLVARADSLEAANIARARESDAIRRDVEVQGRILAKLVKAREDDEGQPDWVNVEDPRDAVSILRGAVRFHDRHVPALGCVMAPCWPWHPLVVVEVVALSQQYVASYGGRPADVSDFLNRWLPGFVSRVRKAMPECNRSEHREDGQTYAADTAMTDRLAEWWATDRRGAPPGLTERQ